MKSKFKIIIKDVMYERGSALRAFQNPLSTEQPQIVVFNINLLLQPHAHINSFYPNINFIFNPSSVLNYNLGILRMIMESNNQIKIISHKNLIMKPNKFKQTILVLINILTLVIAFILAVVAMSNMLTYIVEREFQFKINVITNDYLQFTFNLVIYIVFYVIFIKKIP